MASGRLRDIEELQLRDPAWDHPLHGYAFPLAADDGTGPDQVQEHAVDEVIAFLDRYMKL